jgi:hypothetical protein
MAGIGPPPKENRQRPRDTRRNLGEFVALSADGKIRGPELVGQYSPQTVTWYDTWRRSAQAQLFEPTDWSRLALLAPLVESHYRRPSAAAAGEIRLTEERLGATYVDRLRARIRIERDRPDATVTAIFDASRSATEARLRGLMDSPGSPPTYSPAASVDTDAAPF